MAMSFEQQLNKPLKEEFEENQSTNLLQSIVDPSFSIKYEKFYESLAFLKRMNLDYPIETLEKYVQDLGKYIFKFTITIKENKKQWVIRRRLRDVLNLEDELEHDFHKKLRKFDAKSLKIKDEKGDPIDIANKIVTFIEELLEKAEIRSHPILYRFLEYSNTHLETTTAKKIKELYVNKRAGGRFNENKLFLKCGTCCLCWKKRYLIVTSEGVLLKSDHMSTEEFRENLSFDHHYSLIYGKNATGLERGLILHYSIRKLHLEALDIFSYFDLLYSLIKAFKASSYNVPPRYGSFAPIRENCKCEWFIDGQSYFEAVYLYLSYAKYEVFITDWWLSPELYLRRPVGNSKNQETRIDNVLRRLAENNVKIYIILYKEQTIALTINSKHTQKKLESLHSNIKVLRHPDHPFFLWSHHEKMVVIDQKFAFLGGLDLCFGRMDNAYHHLHDPDHEEKEGEEVFFPGIDFTNSRIKDFIKVKEYEKCRVDKISVPRMPWHDIAMKLEGDSVVDLCRHFIQYWNFAKYDLDPTKKTQNMLISKGNTTLAEERKQTEDRFDAYISNIKERLSVENEDNKAKQENENNKNKEEIEEEKAGLLENPDQNKEKEAIDIVQKWRNESPINKNLVSRKDKVLVVASTLCERPVKKINVLEKFKTMPVHKLEKIETSKEFIQLLTSLREKQMHPDNIRSDINYMQKMEINSNQYPEEIEEDEEEANYIKQQEKPSSIRQKINIFKDSILKSDDHLDESSSFPQLQTFQKVAKKISAEIPRDIKGKVTNKAKCQILRSASNWSIGIKDHENSVHSAYIGIILAAEHFIYIENQFFISALHSSKDNPVLNEITKALYARITRAAKEKKKFKVIVVMPLLPGFEGDVYEGDAVLLKVQLHYEYQTISRGGNSLFEMLEKDPSIENPNDYISFYGLRNHRIMNGKPVTEIIYVHSKLIIVDDKYTIMGSANINDRSMLGNRDSEIAIFVEDQKLIHSKMNSTSYMAGEFSHSLRTSIFQEHFGLSYEAVKDPLSDDFLETIYKNTENNTLLYREIFYCYPDDTIRKIDKNAPYINKEPSIETYSKKKDKIIGHAVEFPRYFLCQESLKIKFMAKENILPDQNFT